MTGPQVADNLALSAKGAGVPVLLSCPVERVDAVGRGYAVTGPGLAEPIRASHLVRSEEHTSELQSLMRISYAVFCLKKKIKCNVTQSITIYVSLMPITETAIIINRTYSSLLYNT